MFHNLKGSSSKPRAWNIRLNKSLKSLNFMKCSQEQVVYTRNNGAETLIVGVYVDDLIITDTSVESIKRVQAANDERL